MKRAALTILALLLLSAPSWAGLGDTVQEFSADQVTVVPGFGERKTRMYIGKDMFRMDDGNNVSIVREDKKVTYMLDTASKTYREIPYDPAAGSGPMGDFEEAVDRKELGHESKEGYQCTKYRIRVKPQAMAGMMGNEQDPQSAAMMAQMGETVTTVWVADKLGIPVRTETDDGMVTIMRNIKIGSQPESLFKVPAGYTKQDMPSMPMGMQMPEGFKMPEGMKMPEGFQMPGMPPVKK